MKALGWKVVAVAGLVVLSACGGGGDNAGLCNGSDEVCGRPAGTNTTSTTGSTQLTPSTPDTTATTTTTPTTSRPPTTTTNTTLGG